MYYCTLVRVVHCHKILFKNNLRIKVLLLIFITAKAYEPDREAIYEQVQDSNLVSSLHRIELEIV